MNETCQKHRLTPSRTRPAIRVLAMGDLDHPDFATAMALLETESDLTRLSSAAAPPSMWDLLLVCQARPGSLASDAWIQCRHQNPLAGRVALLGSWCEGETRTGRPLADLARLFWYQFPSWWELTREAWTSGRPTDWHWPVGHVQAPFEDVASDGLVAIVTPDYASASTMIELFRAQGRAAHWCPPEMPSSEAPSPAACIWIGGMLNETEEMSLRHTREWLPREAPLLVLLDFPRREAVATAMGLGATTVLGKPWRVDLLLSCFRAAAGTELISHQKVAKHNLEDHDQSHHHRADRTQRK